MRFHKSLVWIVLFPIVLFPIAALAATPTPTATTSWGGGWWPLLPPLPPFGGPGAGGSMMPVPPYLLEKLNQEAILAPRGDDLVFTAPSEVPSGIQVVVLINPLTGISEIVGRGDAQTIFREGNLDLGRVPDDAPAGIYYVASCGEGCSTLDTDQQLGWLLEKAAEDKISLTSFAIAPKVTELEVQLTNAGTALAVRWDNASPANGDDIALVWSKDGESSAVLSGVNPLQQIFGYLDASGIGTRIYNTPLINIAPLAPAFAPELAEELSPGTYQVDLYVNGALEGVQRIVVDAP